MPLHEAWVLGALIMLIGLVIGFPSGAWWERSHLELECGEDHDEIWRDGYEQGCDDELASFVAFNESVPRSDDSEGRIAEESGLATMPGAHAGPGHTIYAELTALDVQDVADEVAAAQAAVDPDWHPAFLARSDAWLAEWRANLGLEEAA